MEERYVAQFVVLFWGAVLTLIRLPNTPNFQRLVWTVVVLLVILIGAHIFWNLVATASYGHHASDLQTMQAERLRASGLYPQIKVATIGVVCPDGWQQIARLRVVAELPESDEESFWTANDAVRSHVYDLLAQAGAKYVIASKVPDYAPSTGWVHVNDAPLYLFRLN